MDWNLPKTLFLLSIMWSFRTCSATYVKIRQGEKVNFLPFSGKLVLGTRGLFVCLIRILCGVTFFAPFLGLGNCLAHWVAESKSLSPAMMSNLNSTRAYWDASTVSAIYRSDYTDPLLPIPVPYTAYTLLRLRDASMVFVGLLIFQSLLVLLIKMRLSPQFKAAKWTSRLQHLMMANVFPDSFKDWEFDIDEVAEKTADDYKRSRCAVTKEITSVIFLQFVINLAFLTPLFITCNECFHC